MQFLRLVFQKRFVSRYTQQVVFCWARLFAQPKNALDTPPPNLETLVNCQAQYLCGARVLKCSYSRARSHASLQVQVYKCNFTSYISSILQVILVQFYKLY
jgi:hypothetical protein